MNRIFFWMIAIAIGFGVWRQATWTPDTPAPIEASTTESPEELGLPSAVNALRADLDAQDGRLTRLENKTFGKPLSEEPIKAVEQSIFKYATSSVDLAISLIGAMAFFLGLMKIAEDAGLLLVLAKLIRPLMVALFPDVPPNHPAMGAMIMNMSANALGLGNAATPFGIRAMKELDTLNPHKGTATNAMVLFLAINTSAVTLLPTGVVALRDSVGSTNPAGILGTTLFATLCSTAAALTAAKLYQRFSPVPLPTATPDAVQEDPEIALDEEEEVLASDAYPLWVSICAIACLVGCIPLTLLYGAIVSQWMVPALVTGIIGYGHLRGVPVYESFVVGAKEGFEVAVKIIPYLVAILCAIGMLRASGAITAFVSLVGPATAIVGLPAEALPMALMRPLSGSGAYGVMVSLMVEHGADSYVGYLVSTLQGSTETTFYVLAVYFGAVHVKNTRHALPAALTADLFGIIGAIVAVQLFFAYSM